MQQRPTQVFFGRIHTVKLSPGEKESSYASVLEFMVKCPVRFDDGDFPEMPEQGTM